MKHQLRDASRYTLCVWLLCLALCAPGFSSAASATSFPQDGSQKQTAPPASSSAVSSDAKKPSDTPPSEAADPRQTQILADTQKLLKLSQELKTEVAKSSKDTLSLTVVKKAEEIEKLAKTLKEEMGKAH
jgi:hypothetical protein